MALSPCRPRSLVVDSQQARRYHSLGPWPRTNHQTVTGGRRLPGLAAVVTAAVPPEQASAWLGRWMGRLRRPWGSASCPELCSVCTPKAKAIAGEPIRTSRIYPGESQSAVLIALRLATAGESTCGRKRITYRPGNVLPPHSLYLTVNRRRAG